MRRVVAAFAGLFLGACTTFAFSPPSGVAGDDGGPSDATTPPIPDAGGDTGTDAGAPALLDLTTAARLCALVFACPGLGQAIESSLVIPVATPTTPLNFSGCVDWLAGPVDPNRVGLAQQQAILQAIAGPADAATCAAAYAASPVKPVEAGASCPADSCVGGALQVCSSAGDFSVPCAAPLYAQTGTCVMLATSTAICATSKACTPPGSCSGDSTYVDCYKDGLSYTAYDCTLSGRHCVNAGAPDCVSPGKLAPPCPARGVDDRCDGTSVLHCAGGVLAETEFDCAATQRTCSTASGVARCVGTGDTCSPFDTNGDVNTCSGSTISLCVSGQKTSLDCSKIGLSCVPASGTQTAHCG